MTDNLNVGTPIGKKRSHTVYSWVIANFQDSSVRKTVTAETIK
jgi:hypothetical protein